MSALLLAGFVGLGSASALAAESAPVTSGNDTATLVTDRDAVGPDQHLRVGLRLQLKPGWHTYWINPGDAGDTPTLDVTADGGATGKGGPIHWPVPVRISEGGLMSYAYVNEVTLPEDLVLKGSGGTTLHAHGEWLVCAQVCIPESGDFTLTLPASAQDAPEGAQAALFHKADAAMPVASPFAASVSADGVLTLSGNGLSAASVSQAWFLPQDGGVIDQVADQPLHVSDGQLTLGLKFLKSAHRDKPLVGVVVLKDAAGQESPLQIEARPVGGAASAPVQAAPVPDQASGAEIPTGAGWLRVLLFAFVGGLILNLMPCVFPVLAMKALSLAKMGGAGRGVQLQSALFYTIGVMGAFAALGIVMIGLRLAGSAAGWGFQFQSPGFVVAVCWLLFLMGLNLLGVFEVSAGRLGQVQTGGGRSGDMMTGLLAVIVATPCTAPFMGVAIAGALGGPPVMGVLVFLAMGLGLAFPYILVAGVPGVASRMPKPGAWMGILKQVLAFPLFATCVWLLWVAAIQRGVTFVALTAGGVVLLGFAGWIYGVGQRRSMLEGGRGTVAFCGVVAALCVVVCGAALAQGLRAAPAPVAAGAAEAGVEPFSEARLAELRAQGKPVFIDMTASWCITCMVNERVALDVPSVQEAFRSRGIVFLKGDWTNRNAAIAAFLKAHGRDGVPFYMYYAPHQDGVVLPQILTPGIVTSTIGK
ncbi:protein-disulfide reductase DsbD family protein [Gluconobacter oxydans]|uniref:Thiol:disulfide interchange protein DsbD n=1 Tax=Gluconobacter oxydans NBRC 3293 TaxID=1315969 RepID=A0A829WHU4_GLUOY|nr:thioredoxin family protein [Gluconobacter oxydans]GEM16378.1 thiol:disulfide interchange protein DsbD [Gluconobacter oxydans NBRC 3293]